MKKATVKGFAMFGLLAVMTIITAGASAKAQSLDYRLTANIPFDFSVADKKLPAGKYWISRAQQNQGDMVVQIRSTKGNANVIRLTIPVNTLYPVRDAAVVFHRYGNEYFLSEVWPKGGSVGRALTKTRVERELERKSQDNQIAATRGPELETVTIRASN
jgi:hypothetical protein